MEYIFDPFLMNEEDFTQWLVLKHVYYILIRMSVLVKHVIKYYRI